MSIERSAELLRLALPWMSRQAAGLHPVSYAVWFDYVAQTNPPLRAAIDEHLAREGSLDEFATHALFKRHVAEVDPETARRVADSMQRALGGIGEAIVSAGSHATRFSASLTQLAVALERGDTSRGIAADIAPSGIARNGPAPRQLADVVAEVIADTGTMRSQIGGLQQRLADSRREIERLRDEVRRARDEALLDSLTGLANRRAFDQALAACLSASTPAAPAWSAAGAAGSAIETARAQAARTAAAPAAVPAAAARGPWLMMSDIDNFRRINDVYGHAFGDQVLQAVAGAFGELMPSGATLARVGGESFAVLVPRLDAESALALAERLRERIGGARIRRPDHDEAEQVTLSLGIAPFHPGEAAQALVERARQALARAKSDGRNRTVSAA